MLGDSQLIQELDDEKFTPLLHYSFWNLTLGDLREISEKDLVKGVKFADKILMRVFVRKYVYPEEIDSEESSEEERTPPRRTTRSSSVCR